MQGRLTLSGSCRGRRRRRSGRRTIRAQRLRRWHHHHRAVGSLGSRRQRCRADDDHQGVGGQGEGRGQMILTSAGQQAAADLVGRSAGQVRPRHHGVHQLGGAERRLRSSRSTMSCTTGRRPKRPHRTCSRVSREIRGRWVAVPMTRGTLLLGVCSRFDMIKQHAGVDVQAMYPAGKPPTDATGHGRTSSLPPRSARRPAAALACRWADDRHDPVGRRSLPGLRRRADGRER